MQPTSSHPLSWRARLVGSLAAGALIGAVVAVLGPGPFLRGWLAAGLLSAAAIFFLMWSWQAVGGGRRLGWMVTLAFLLRLGLGMSVSYALPVWGYDTDCQNAGYLFRDACERDQEAFGIAQKGEGLYWFSGIQLDSDQYGGLAFLSGWIYRYLSPDTHRPFLILIVCAFLAALGVPFLVRGVRLRWNENVAALAGWIYALYPDGLFFGSAQMREPALMGLGAVAFWSVITWEQNRRQKLLTGFAALLGMAFFSPRVALPVAGVLIVWWWLEFSGSHIGENSTTDRRWHWLGWAGLAAALLIVIVLMAGWFVGSASYDIQQTIANSGWIAKIIEEAGSRLALPIIIVYGLAQPVLPAAVAETAIPLWKGIGIFRAAGWYAMAPFLVYGLFAAFREQDPRRKRIFLWLALTVAVWAVIATIRGGGDQTDNPRYRTIFLPWMALLAAWVVDWVRAHHDHWLWRWIAVEVIFLGFFTNWYVSRYWRVMDRLPFWSMVAWIAVLSALVLVGGWLWDRMHARKIRV